MISPNSIQTYNLRYKTQSQKVRFEVAALTQYSTFRWSFRPKAVLELSAGTTGGISVRQSTGFSGAQVWGSINSTPVIGIPVPNTRRIIVNFSVGSTYQKKRKIYGANFTATLYVLVGGVWKTWARAHRPIHHGGYHAGIGSWVVDTGFQAGDISQFFVNYTYDGSLTRIVKFSQTFLKNGTAFGNIYIKDYSSDQGAYSGLEPGTLNWLAIGS